MRILSKTQLKSNFVNQITKLCTVLPQKYDNYKTIYKFPYITGLGLINRLKFYYTGLSFFTVSGVTISRVLEVCTNDDMVLINLVALSGLVPLYTAGYFADKMIGIVYFNEKKRNIRVAYLDFWGARKDISIDIDDLVPFSENPRAITDMFYVKCKRYSTKDQFKLCANHGILDHEQFNKVFAKPF